jgi:hypothetical protein
VCLNAVTDPEVLDFYKTLLSFDPRSFEEANGRWCWCDNTGPISWSDNSKGRSWCCWKNQDGLRAWVAPKKGIIYNEYIPVTFGSLGSSTRNTIDLDIGQLDWTR